MTEDRHRPSALLIGDDPVNALGVARNLGRESIEVHRLGGSESRLFRSRYIHSSSIFLALEDCPDREYVVAIERACPEEGPVVIFPLTDLHVLRVSRNMNKLEGRFRFPGCRPETAEILVNKRRFCQSLVELGIPHPRTAWAATRPEYESEAQSIGYPVFLKPEISPLFSRRFNTKGFVANDRFELARHVQRIQASGLPVVMQEIIPGGAECLHGCAGFRTETQTLLFCYRRVREFPGGFGTSSFQESVAPFVGQTRLLEYLKHIGYTGIFEAEFKLDPRDGILKMIEINARAWWQTTHPTISGLNIIKAAYDYALGGSIQPGPYKVGTKWIHLYNDYFASKAAGVGLVKWIRSFRGETAYDLWSNDDMTPMIAFLTGLVRRKLSNTFLNRAGATATTATRSSSAR
jgi:D-aspartate ligase